MNSIFMFCYPTITDAQRVMETLKAYYEEDPLNYIRSIELATSKHEVKYPFWVGIMFEQRFLHPVDEWVCDHDIDDITDTYNFDFYSGPTRYAQFRELAMLVRRITCVRGKITEDVQVD